MLLVTVLVVVRFITSVGVSVLVGVAVKVYVIVGVGVDVRVEVEVGVDMRVEVGVGVDVCVEVEVGVDVRVEVEVGVDVRVEVEVEVGVSVTGNTLTALTAPAASTMPLPQVDAVQLLPAGKSLAVLCKAWSICSKLSVGLIDNIRDTTPVT